MRGKLIFNDCDSIRVEKMAVLNDDGSLVIGTCKEGTQWFYPERTCTIESQIYYNDGSYEPYYEVELSCGDLVVWDETYSVGMFCPFCGARVIEEDE